MRCLQPRLRVARGRGGGGCTGLGNGIWMGTNRALYTAPNTPTQIHPRHSSPSGPPKMQAWCTVPSVRPYGQPPYSSPVPLGSSPKPRKWKPGPRSIQHPPSFPPPILLSVPACLPLSSGVCLGLFVILCTYHAISCPHAFPVLPLRLRFPPPLHLRNTQASAYHNA